MKILYRKKFKKLREEYADLGDVKLDLIEEAAKNYNSPYYTGGIGSNINIKFDLNTIDTANVTRGAEYFLKYRALLKKRDGVRGGLAIGGATAATGWFIWKCVDVCKNNATLEEEYQRGKQATYDNIEQYCRENGCGDSWIGDTSDGKHMILRISDEETEDYKAFQDSMKELEEYDDEI